MPRRGVQLGHLQRLPTSRRDLSRRDNTDRSGTKESVPRKNRPVGYYDRHEKVFAMEGKLYRRSRAYNVNFFSCLIRNFVAPITPARITPYPAGRLFWGGAVPSTSCQATIAPSLLDISQQGLARCCCEMSASASRRDNIDRLGGPASPV